MSTGAQSQWPEFATILERMADYHSQAAAPPPRQPEYAPSKRAELPHGIQNLATDREKAIVWIRFYALGIEKDTEGRWIGLFDADGQILSKKSMPGFVQRQLALADSTPNPISPDLSYSQSNDLRKLVPEPAT